MSGSGAFLALAPPTSAGGFAAMEVFVVAVDDTPAAAVAAEAFGLPALIALSLSTVAADSAAILPKNTDVDAVCALRPAPPPPALWLLLFCTDRR
jgi:hypothetical protein